MSLTWFGSWPVPRQIARAPGRGRLPGTHPVPRCPSASRSSRVRGRRRNRCSGSSPAATGASAAFETRIWRICRVANGSGAVARARG